MTRFFQPSDDLRSYVTLGENNESINFKMAGLRKYPIVKAFKLLELSD